MRERKNKEKRRVTELEESNGEGNLRTIKAEMTRTMLGKSMDNGHTKGGVDANQDDEGDSLDNATKRRKKINVLGRKRERQ
jgi:hypothetical protein